ncbi:MAG: STAS domain-containing protein [Paracoccaceae bacterium]|nr:STAS domain-containing protein [Paracoccaceae bacterium]MDE2911836.1 STAS domain-containing protein [Paracoccaceae bacterium]
MEITTTTENGAVFAAVSGRVDGSNAKQFEDGLMAGVGEDSQALVLDLAELSYISSAGLRAILLTAKNLGKRNSKFLICSLNPAVAEIFSISGFDRIITIMKTRDEARASLS